MYLNNPAEEAQLQNEAAQFAKKREHSSEVERQSAMNSMDYATTGAREDGGDFEAYHRHQVTVRDFTKFRKAHPEYLHTTNNRAALIGLLQSRGLEDADFATYEEAFLTLAAEGKLELDLAKATTEDLDNLSAEEIFARYQQDAAQAEQERRADLEAYNSTNSGAKAAERFLRLHPEYLHTPENSAAMQRMLKSHGVNLEAPTFDQLTDAFNELASAGELELDASKVKPSSFSEASLYSMKLTDLEKLAGGRDDNRPDDYVPNGSFRPGDFSTFEPGADQ
jgi:hypothetical protein